MSMDSKYFGIWVINVEYNLHAGVIVKKTYL
jgi:hypothetical protein